MHLIWFCNLVNLVRASWSSHPEPDRNPYVKSTWTAKHTCWESNKWFHSKLQRVAAGELGPPESPGPPSGAESAKKPSLWQIAVFTSCPGWDLAGADGKAQPKKKKKKATLLFPPFWIHPSASLPPFLSFPPSLPTVFPPSHPSQTCTRPRGPAEKKIKKECTFCSCKTLKRFLLLPFEIGDSWTRSRCWRCISTIKKILN